MDSNSCNKKEFEALNRGNGIDIVQHGFDYLAIMGSEISTELISDNNGDVEVAVLIYTHIGGAEAEQVLRAKGGNRHGGGSRERRMTLLLQLTAFRLIDTNCLRRVNVNY